MPRRISESAEDICDVCSEAITIFAIGKCDHSVCLRCSTRLRVLIDDMTCPICRTELPKVVFLKSRKLFDKILWQKFKFNRKYAIYFEDAAVEDVFKKLLEHQCQLCPDRPPDRGFMHLKTHMSKEHSLYYCDICVEHLKVFSGERRYYNRKDLALHRRVGDANDTSHKGHPLCEFCDERYLDNDELLRHLRKEHYFCHFCDQDGSNQYYSDYDVLREHFLGQHYLCEEEDCAGAQFTNAFKSLIDLKGHQAHYHAGGLRKGQIKQNRHLDIEINLAPRANKSGRRERGVVAGDDFDEVGKGRGRGRGQGGERGRGGYRHDRRTRRDDDDDDDDVRQGIAASLADNQKPEGGGAASEQDPEPLQVTSYSDDFPTIGAAASNAPAPIGGNSMANRFARDNKMSVKESGHVDDFPELPTSRELQQHAKKVPVHALKVWKFTHTPEPKNAPSAGIQNKSKKKLGGLEFKVPKEAQIVEKQEDFPALPSSEKSEPARPVTSPPQRPTPASAKPVSKPDLPFKQPPLAAVAARPANVSSSNPTLSSIGNLLTEKPKGNGAAVGKPRTYFSSGNTPSLASDSDFPSLGGGYQAAQVDSWVANTKDPVQPSPNINLIQSKTRDFPEPAHNNRQPPMQSYNTNAFKVDEDFPSLGGGGVQMPATWVTSGKVSNRIKQKPLNVKPVATASQRLKVAAAKPKKNEGPPPSNLEGLLSTPDPVKPVQNVHVIADDSEFITVVSKPKKKPEPEVATETKQGKKKKKKKGKGNKDAKEEGKENADDLVIGYALATLEEAEMKPQEPEVIPEADFRMGGEEKTRSKGKSKKEKKQAEKVKSVPKESCQDTWTSVPKESPQDSWTEVKRDPDRESQVDHVKVISNKNLSNVEKLAHMNNFSLLEEVEDIPEEVPTPQHKGNKKNTKVPDFNSDDFPALGGGSRRPNNWMEKPRDYSSAKSQKNVKETSPFSVTMPDSNVPPSSMPGLQPDDFPSLENIATYPSMPSPTSPPGLHIARSFAAEDSKPFKPPPGFVSGGSLSAIASSLGGAPKPKAPAPPKPLKMSYQYAQPPNFQERNQKLIFEFQNLLSSPQEFDEFKYFSGQFRQGLTSAQQYYTDCIALMGADRFMVVFPELLVLLPDIDKQKELYDAFKSCIKKNSFMKKQELHFQKCSTCCQVLTQKDFGYHTCICVPDLPEDFPSF